MAKLGTSQNGWPVYDDTSHFVRTEVAGVKFWAANEDVATCLGYFTQEFNDRIEIINRPVKESPGYDDWSYAVRPVRGQTTGYSNHASATAWDLDSTEHPRGVEGTYTAHERAVLRDILADPVLADDHGKPVLRSGEFYTTTIDGMHVEVNASPASIAQAARKVRAKAQEENEMQLSDKVELSAAAARALNAAGNEFKEGDEVSVKYLLLWGPARAQEAEQRAERLEAELDKAQSAIATLDDKVDQLLARIPASASAAQR